MMKERPLLFTPENAQKCHVGTKTQTRRIVKPQPTVNEHGYVQWTPRSEGHNGVYTPDSFLAECPYGVPGDRLWCKEAWRLAGDFANVSTGDIPKDKAWLYVDALRYRGEAHSEGIDKWRSGMLMPRWACRTVLEITEIRVQRVQEISEEDAMAEGCPTHVAEHTFRKCYRDPLERAIQRIESFQRLWESINGPGSWAANPWVWAITFKKVA